MPWHGETSDSRSLFLEASLTNLFLPSLVFLPDAAWNRTLFFPSPTPSLEGLNCIRVQNHQSILNNCECWKETKVNRGPWLLGHTCPCPDGPFVTSAPSTTTTWPLPKAEVGEQEALKSFHLAFSEVCSLLMVFSRPNPWGTTAERGAEAEIKGD